MLSFQPTDQTNQLRSHLLSIQAGVSRAMVMNSTESIGGLISLEFRGREPGLIDWGIGVLGDIGLGVLDREGHLLGWLA